MNALPILSAVLILGVTEVLAPFVDHASRDGRRGNERYAAGDWDHALEQYQKAAAARPDGVFQYNLGTAAYRKKDYRAATQAFSRATGDVKVDRDAAAYNLGNTRFRAGDLKGALSAYRAALCANPSDADARQNYELTLRQLKSSPPDSSRQNQKNQQDQQNQDQGQKQPQQQSSNPDQQSGQNQNQSQQNQPQPQPNQQNQPNPENQGGQPGDKNQEQQQQNQGQNGQEPKADSTGMAPNKPGQMTPAEAKRLLNAVTPEERELLQARLKATRKHRAEKDW